MKQETAALKNKLRAIEEKEKMDSFMKQYVTTREWVEDWYFLFILHCCLMGLWVHNLCLTIYVKIFAPWGNVMSGLKWGGVYVILQYGKYKFTLKI